MIDVCFQLIIFFIANMHIFTPEGDFNIQMPGAVLGEKVLNDSQIPTIQIRLFADKKGNLSGIQMGERPVKTFKDLRHEIREIVGTDHGPSGVAIDTEAVFDCDYNLKFEYIIDALTAVSGYLADDKQTVIRMIDKIRFAPPKNPE